MQIFRDESMCRLLSMKQYMYRPALVVVVLALNIVVSSAHDAVDHRLPREDRMLQDLEEECGAPLMTEDEIYEAILFEQLYFEGLEDLGSLQARARREYTDEPPSGMNSLKQIWENVVDIVTNRDNNPEREEGRSPAFSPGPGPPSVQGGAPPPVSDTNDRAPTASPSIAPTIMPTEFPSDQELFPTSEPTDNPTSGPTMDPSGKPFAQTMEPTSDPTTMSPSDTPTKKPTEYPTDGPTMDPTLEPTGVPTIEPTSFPSRMPQPSGITIPTYYFVIRPEIPDGREPSDEQVAEQHRILNAAFAEDDFNFVLKGPVQRITNDEWYSYAASGIGSTDIAMKTALRNGGRDTLHVWINRGGGYCGYAYYPRGSAGLARDGVVLNNLCFPGAGTSKLGDTLVHEVGHWLGLPHSFQGGCSSPGDGIDDTPYHIKTSGCPMPYPNTCYNGDGLPDPVDNYMNYSGDTCRDVFTRGQKSRMLSQWHIYRASP